MSHYPPTAKWNEMAEGGIIPQAGNAVEYKTGGWRNERPIKDNECCIDCFFCWVYCPDSIGGTGCPFCGEAFYPEQRRSIGGCFFLIGSERVYSVGKQCSVN